MQKISYQDSGVNIEAGYQAVERIKALTKQTYRPEVLSGVGGFNALFALGKYRDPILVSGTDGVGTKLKIAFLMDRHDSVGIDLVAMCVNDILTSGAEPLFFLDYIACGKLMPYKIESIIQGITEGCRQAGCALIGGETAEMPGFYPENEYDLAGFVVGVVEKENLIDGSRCEEGDVLVGIESSGIHSNGFSLVRKLFLGKYDLTTYCNGLGISLGEELLKPTQIYVQPILDLLKHVPVRALSHITGGGFYENITRTIPQEFVVVIHQKQWPCLPVFDLLQEESRLNRDEMFNIFNMGIGFTVCVPSSLQETTVGILSKYGLKAYPIGYLEQKNHRETYKNSRVILLS